MKFLILACSLATAIIASPHPVKNINDKNSKQYEGINGKYLSANDYQSILSEFYKNNNIGPINSWGKYNDHSSKGGERNDQSNMGWVPSYYNIQDVANAINSGRV